MSMNIVKSGLVFGLLLSIGAYAEEAEKPKEATKVSQEVSGDEEVANRVFDTWYEGKNSINYCSLADGHIDKVEQNGRVYLQTVIALVKLNDFFLEEQEDFSPFLIKKLFNAVHAGRIGEHSAFLDRKTRCVISHINGGNEHLRCDCVYTKEEFKRRMQKKDQENRIVLYR